jgi:hypothetical protein
VKIDRRLNLVVSVERDDGPLYVHSAPIGQETFEKYFLVISKAFSAIYAEGLNVYSGPRVAMMILKQIAMDSASWDGVEGVENGLLAEITRLSNVIAPTDKGWTSVPLHDALEREVLAPDEVSEVMNAICFFIVASAMHRRKELEPVLRGLSRLWGAQLTSSNATEFMSSLPTSTSEDNSGVRAPPSSIPI